MLSSLLAADPKLPAGDGNNYVWLVVGAVVVIIGFIMILVLLGFVRLWVQGLLTGAKIGILDLVGMKLRNVDYQMIVRQKIALVQATVKVSTRDLEAHYLSRG